MCENRSLQKAIHYVPNYEKPTRVTRVRAPKIGGKNTYNVC